MARNDIQQRRKRYFKLSPAIALMDNARLHSLFEAAESNSGWGRNHAIDIGQSKVFVKRVPVTDLEYENMFSTKNLYDLPTYYNYGVGSAGFGVFRELVAHIKTTNWVLEGAIETFPLMYHYRIVPFSGERKDVDMERHQSYVEYWGSNENIGKYMLDRANANHELVLFLEYIPHTLQPWLLENPGKLNRILEDLRTTVDFLRTHGILHFDAHFYNIVTEGERAYLTDFGLVLDKSFALTEEEASFFKKHVFYDYGEVLVCLSFFLGAAYEACSEEDKRILIEKYGIPEDRQHRELVPALLDNIEQIHADGILKIPAIGTSSLIQYRNVITLMNNFYSDMRRNNRKDTKLDHARLRRLLTETGYLRQAG